MSLSSSNGNIYPLSKRHGHCFLFNQQTYRNSERKSVNFAILLLLPRRFKFSWFIIAMALLSAARILDYVCHECLLLEVNQLLSKSHLSSSFLLFLSSNPSPSFFPFPFTPFLVSVVLAEIVLYLVFFMGSKKPVSHFLAPFRFLCCCCFFLLSRTPLFPHFRFPNLLQKVP